MLKRKIEIDNANRRFRAIMVEFDFFDKYQMITRTTRVNKKGIEKNIVSPGILKRKF